MVLRHAGRSRAHLGHAWLADHLAAAGPLPSGLGFRPDGSLLIASTEDRLVLRYDGETVVTIADLTDLAPASLGDMVIDDAGRAYIGSQASQALGGGLIIRLDPDDSATVVAEDLDFPNGMVITPDGKTLIVAESIGRRLTRFTISEDGALSDRRVFADGLDGPPDGIALDAEGGVWTSMTLAHQFERIIAGGTVTDRIDMGERVAIACTLGGPERRTLFLLSSTDAYPKRLVGTRHSRLDAVTGRHARRRPALTRPLTQRGGGRMTDSYYELIDAADPLGEKFTATDLVRGTWTAAIQHAGAGFGAAGASAASGVPGATTPGSAGSSSTCWDRCRPRETSGFARNSTAAASRSSWSAPRCWRWVPTASPGRSPGPADGGCSSWTPRPWPTRPHPAAATADRSPQPRPRRRTGTATTCTAWIGSG